MKWSMEEQEGASIQTHRDRKGLSRFGQQDVVQHDESKCESEELAEVERRGEDSRVIKDFVHHASNFGLHPEVV